MSPNRKKKMIIITLVLLLIPGVIIIAVLKTKGKSRKILFLLPVIIILIPICLILITPYMQRGKIFPAIGKMSFPFFEPKDLWNPLASTTLDKNKKEYNFTFSHKYVGNHDIEIRFSNKNVDVWKINKKELELTAIFQDGKKQLLSKKTTYVSRFKGLRGNGFIYIRYSLPDDLPINQRLNVKITVNGDIEKFINKYGDSRIIIKKGSDL